MKPSTFKILALSAVIATIFVTLKMENMRGTQPTQQWREHAR